MKHRNLNDWRTHPPISVRAAVEQLEGRNVLSASMLPLLAWEPSPLVPLESTWELPPDSHLSAVESPTTDWLDLASNEKAEATDCPAWSDGSSNLDAEWRKPDASNMPEPAMPEPAAHECPRSPEPDAAGPSKPSVVTDPTAVTEPTVVTEPSSEPWSNSEPWSSISTPGLTNTTPQPDVTSRTDVDKTDPDSTDLGKGIESGEIASGTTSRGESRQSEADARDSTHPLGMSPQTPTTIDTTFQASVGPQVLNHKQVVAGPKGESSSPVVAATMAPITSTLVIGEPSDLVLNSRPLVSLTSGPVSSSLRPTAGQRLGTEPSAGRPVTSPALVVPTAAMPSYFAGQPVTPLSIAGQAAYDPLVTLVLHRTSAPSNRTLVPSASASVPPSRIRARETDAVFATTTVPASSAELELPDGSEPTFTPSAHPAMQAVGNTAPHAAARRALRQAADTSSRETSDVSWLAPWRPYWHKLVALSSGSLLFLPFAQRPRKARQADTQLAVE